MAITGYTPPQIAALMMLFFRNAVNLEVFGDFDTQLNRMETEMAGDAELAPPIIAIRKFWMGQGADDIVDLTTQRLNRYQLSQAHIAIMTVLDSLGMTTDWGGCRYVEKNRIAQISSLPH